MKDNYESKFYNRGRARQLVDFSGLERDKMCPTDIDGYYEISNKLSIFFEFKYRDNPLPRGQELALERLGDDTTNDKKRSIVIVATHDIDDTDKDIDAGACIVDRYWYEKKWGTPKRETTLKEAINKFIDKYS